MSEADFYVKAVFPAENLKKNGFKSPKDFIEKMNTLLRRCKALHEHWQDIRGMEVPQKTMEDNVRSYDSDLYDRLKLDEFPSGWGTQNRFTGLIPCWQVEITQYDFAPAKKPNPALLTFSGELWSSTNLAPFMNLLKSIGASQVGWICGDEVDPYASIEL